MSRRCAVQRLGGRRWARCDRRRVPSYLVESYLTDSRAAVDEARERARSLTDEDVGVRYLRTTFLPGDETILHVFEAPSMAKRREER